ncbi:MAG: hypothetical protein WCK42_08610 [Myxococcaceae bacterium]
MAQLPVEIHLTSEMVQLLSEIDEFKGRFSGLQNIPRDQLSLLRKVATIESVGSSTRIEGVKLSDKEVEALLDKLELQSFDDQSPSLSILSERIYQLAAVQSRLTMADIEREISAPKSTVKFHLKQLTVNGHLMRHGQGRATWYTRA